MNNAEINKIIKSIDWQMSHQDQNPEVYYKYRDSGIWFPESLHKPYLAAVVEEHEALLKRYQVVLGVFKADEP